MSCFEKYGYVPDEARIASAVEEAGRRKIDPSCREDLRNCFSMMDLTSLHPQDTAASVASLVRKAGEVVSEFPGYPLPASVCVFSNFASVVRDERVSPSLHVTVVSACFPSSQSFLEVKLLECRMAVRDGADEVDVVLALNSFMAGDLDAAGNEIRCIREVIDEEAASLGRKVILKVILETGVLKESALIARASFLSMENGADFIKTSTGKVDVNATPQAAVVMCCCIRSFYEKTGKKIGFKAAGGISTAEDAFLYYNIVRNILGPEWLCKDLFRFGVSRLGNNLIGAIEGRSVKYF